MVSCRGTDLWRWWESGSSAWAMAFTRNVLHSVFSEKQGSQPKKGWTVAFRRSVRKPCKRVGHGLQGRAGQYKT